MIEYNAVSAADQGITLTSECEIPEFNASVTTRFFEVDHGNFVPESKTVAFMGKYPRIIRVQSWCHTVSYTHLDVYKRQEHI